MICVFFACNRYQFQTKLLIWPRSVHGLNFSWELLGITEIWLFEVGIFFQGKKRDKKLISIILFENQIFSLHICLCTLKNIAVCEMLLLNANLNCICTQNLCNCPTFSHSALIHISFVWLFRQQKKPYHCQYIPNCNPPLYVAISFYPIFMYKHWSEHYFFLNKLGCRSYLLQLGSYTFDILFLCQMYPISKIKVN